MRAVFDINVILDVLADREPFAGHSASAMKLAARAGGEGAATANTITDIAYLLRKHIGKRDAKTAMLGLTQLLHIVEVSHEDCRRAFDLPMDDYEDALLAVCARRWGADCIVTRDTKDFAKSPVPAMSPEQFLQKYKDSL